MKCYLKISCLLEWKLGVCLKVIALMLCDKLLPQCHSASPLQVIYQGLLLTICKSIGNLNDYSSVSYSLTWG